MKQIQPTAYSPKDEDIEEGKYHISPGIIGGSPKWGHQFIDLQKHKEKHLQVSTTMYARQIQALSSANLLIGCDNRVKQEEDKTLALSPFPPAQLHMMPNITPDPTTTPRRRVGLVHAAWGLGEKKSIIPGGFHTIVSNDGKQELLRAADILLVGVVEPPAKYHLPNTRLCYTVRQSPPDFCGCCWCCYCCCYYYNYCCFRVPWPPWRECNCAQRKLPGKKNQTQNSPVLQSNGELGSLEHWAHAAPFACRYRRGR